LESIRKEANSHLARIELVVHVAPVLYIDSVSGVQRTSCLRSTGTLY